VCLRLAAVGVGVLVLVCIEVILVLADVAPLSPADDPFVGFAAVHPLFVTSPDGTRYQTSATRLGFFARDSFSVRKSATGRRVFVVGGSTVQGRPFSIETSFTQFLEAALNKTHPSTQWEVVNCGGISYASYRLVAIVEECLNYEPDLIIVCTGHNEFLERIEYPPASTRPSVVAQTHGGLSRLRSFRLVRSLVAPSDEFQAAGTDRSVLSAEADAMLDHAGGLDAYRRDVQRAEVTGVHFQFNLRRIVRATEQAGVPLLLIQPPSNLSDCPPFKSEFSSSTSPRDQQRIHALHHQASQLLQSDLTAATDILRKAVQADPAYAFSWYQLGKVLQANSDFDAARNAYQQAMDNDICPLRMTTNLQDRMRQVVVSEHLHFINANTLIQELSDNHITGGDKLVDHIHPSFHGHQDIAFAILAWMAAHELTPPLPAEAHRTCDDLWSNSLQSLDNLYFLRGQRALKDLHGWAAGRVQRHRLPSEAAAN
jgi:lysophospholipase L1-like esterase